VSLFIKARRVPTSECLKTQSFFGGASIERLLGTWHQRQGFDVIGASERHHLDAEFRKLIK
jgi:hypothetical protein